jgi:hypothetical protein
MTQALGNSAGAHHEREGFSPAWRCRIFRAAQPDHLQSQALGL